MIRLKKDILSLPLSRDQGWNSLTVEPGTPDRYRAIFLERHREAISGRGVNKEAVLLCTAIDCGSLPAPKLAKACNLSAPLCLYYFRRYIGGYFETAALVYCRPPETLSPLPDSIASGKSCLLANAVCTLSSAQGLAAGDQLTKKMVGGEPSDVVHWDDEWRSGWHCKPSGDGGRCKMYE